MSSASSGSRIRRRIKLTSLVRSRTTVAVMSLSRSVIGCEVGGGSMRLKTFQEREYCGERKKSFLEQYGPAATA
ncbi:exported hypothetical protein [Paraburkholderia ribeironis]|uniref:Uncharacterized protein n=1 Tax=Paraburkholderia ribeironis TaxID=1247936 RepID=A0A1N7RYB1_9BURK|nr:exported hypothetical protein [Paraburkholderia ribeironis]